MGNGHPGEPSWCHGRPHSRAPQSLLKESFAHAPQPAVRPRHGHVRAGNVRCSDSADDKPPSTPITVEIAEEGGEVRASQDVVEAQRGQEIELVVSSDSVDEFHVHSDPEQEFAIEEGDDQTFTFSIDTAGEYARETFRFPRRTPSSGSR